MGVVEDQLIENQRLPSLLSSDEWDDGFRNSSGSTDLEEISLDDEILEFEPVRPDYYVSQYTNKITPLSQNGYANGLNQPNSREK